MKTKRDFLLPYSVKLTYIDEKKLGSGIVVPVNENNFYLITAKHNFVKEENNPLEEVTSIEIEKIKVLNDKGIEICKVLNCVYIDDNPDDDLIVFSLKDMNESLKLLDPIIILKDEPTDEYEHFFRGYPNGKPDLMDGLSSRNRDSSKPNIFTFKNQLQIEKNYLAGYSGSGVFIRDESIFYLVGIVLESKDGIYKYTCYDLSKVIDKINKVISPKIKVKQDVVDITTTENMYTRMINRNKDSFFVKRAKQIFKKQHIYKDLKDREKLEKLANYIKDTNKFEELEQEYQKKLADLYLLGAFVSKEYADNKTEVKKFFEKARLYEPRYVRYKDNLEQIDHEEAFKIGKLAYMDNKLDKAKEYLEKALFTDSKSTKIKIYEILTKVYSDKKNLINTYNQLVEFYDKKEIEKANALYHLSELYEDDFLKKETLLKAFEIVRDTEDSFLYELEYKITKKFAELYQEEKLLYMMKPILEKLVKEKKEYQSELQIVLSLENQINEGKTLEHTLEEEKQMHESYKYYSSYIKTEEIKKLKNNIRDLTIKNKNMLEGKSKIKEKLDTIQYILNKFWIAILIAILLGIIIGYMI
jgi:hypothetical protein